MDRERFLPNITEEDRKLIKLFQDEVDRINLLYLKAIHSNDLTKANQLLKQIKKISNYLSTEYGKWADVRLPQEYVKGSSYMDDIMETDTAVLQLSQQAVETYLEELGPIHIEAVNALVDNSKNYVRSSLDGMERQALTMLNELQQYQVRQELAKGIISGEASSNERLIDYFTSQGISGFKDRGGKYWSMDRYVDMLTRTETAIANTQGTINRAIEVGITKFGIVEHSDCCEVCAEMNGDIVDITEGTVELPPFHPNCRGYIVAIVDEEEWRKRLIEPEQVEKIGQPTEEFKLTDEMKDFVRIGRAEIGSRLNWNYDEQHIKEMFPMGYDNAVVASTYTSGNYSDWNKALREGNVSPMFKSLTQSFHNTIKGYGVKAEGTLYRGSELPKSVFDELIETKQYSDKGFMSFSVSESDAEEYVGQRGIYDKERVPVIFVLDNGKGLPMGKFTVNKMSEEYVINNETKFTVRKIIEDKKKDYFKIYLRQR